MKLGIVGKFVDGVEPIFVKAFKDKFELVICYDPTDISSFSDVDMMILKGSGFGTAADFKKMKCLKYLQKWGSGLNAIDLDAASIQGIAVANVPGGNSASVAELAVYHMVTLLRNIIPQTKAEENGQWVRETYMSSSRNLHNKLVGLVGSGYVGLQVAKLVQCYGAKVQYFDVKRLPESVEQDMHLQYVGMDDLLATSDIVSLHIPLLDSTKNMIDHTALDKMKPTALLINTARGGLVDENALVNAIKNGHIAGAGLDCIAHEPIDKENPLMHNDKIFLTPHIGGCSGDLAEQMAPMIIKDVLVFADGKEVKSVTNYAMLKK